MAVCMPAARAQIHLHVAGTRRIVADLNDRPAEIRPALSAGKTRVKNADGPLVGGQELFAAQALMLPDGLQQAFRGRIIFIAQDTDRAVTQAPVNVKIFGQRGHASLLLRLQPRKVKPWRKHFERI